MLMEQELLTLLEHLCSPPVFSGVRVTRSLVLCVCFVIVVCNFVLFLLAIVLSVLLGLTDSEYPFGIFWPLCCLFFFDLRILITPLVSFGHCVVCSSSTYWFWLPLWHLQTLLNGIQLAKSGFFIEKYHQYTWMWDKKDLASEIQNII
jgi:hypothetical protein